MFHLRSSIVLNSLGCKSTTDLCIQPQISVSKYTRNLWQSVVTCKLTIILVVEFSACYINGLNELGNLLLWRLFRICLIILLSEIHCVKCLCLTIWFLFQFSMFYFNCSSEQYFLLFRSFACHFIGSTAFLFNFAIIFYII